MLGKPEAPDRKLIVALVLRLAAFLAAVGLAGGLLWPEGASSTAPRDAVVAAFATFPLMLIAVLIIGWRLAVIAGDDVTTRDGITVNSIAQLVALLVPSRLSEIAKPVGLNLTCNVPLSRGLTILAIERIFDAIFLAGLALAAVAVVAGPYRESMQSSGLLLVGFAAIGLLIIGAVLVRPALLINLSERLSVEWLRAQVEHVVDAVTRLADLRTTMLAAGLSAVAWLASYLIFVVFFLIFDIGELTLGQVLVVFVAGTLGLIISVAPGGLGTFEGAIALSLVAFGIPMGTAITMALLLRLCLVIPVVVAASWFLLSGNLSLPRILARLKDWKGRTEPSD